MKLLLCLSVFVLLANAEVLKDEVKTPVERMSPEEAAVAVYFSNVAYGFDGQCVSLNQECNRAARNPIQKIQCLIQLGVCVGAKAVGCSGHCIAPMIQCKLANIGNWPGIFKCAAEFIACSAGGCLGGAGGGAGGAPGGGGAPGCGGPEEPPCMYGGKEISPIDAAVAVYYSDDKEAYNLFDDTCRKLHQDCSRSATGIVQKIGCLTQLGLCIGAKVVGCSKDCIAPLIQCKLSAIGNWPAMFKCAADFIGCAAGGCLGGAGGSTGGTDGGPDGGLPDGGQLPPGVFFEDQLSPEDAAVEMFFGDKKSTDNVKYGFDGQCHSLHTECKRAARNPMQGIQCLIQLGMCVGAKAVGCSGHCIAPMIQCKLANIGNWPGIFKCCADFIGCAAGGCLGGGGGGGGGDGGLPEGGMGGGPPDMMSPMDTALEPSEEANDGIIDVVGQCHSLIHECNRAARNFFERLQCMAQLGVCLGAQVLKCSGHCIPSMIQCKLAAIGNMPGLMMCCGKFVACSAAGCLGGGGGGGGDMGGGMPGGGMGGPPPGGMGGYAFTAEAKSKAEKAISPINAAVEMYYSDNTAYGLFDDTCRMMHGECDRAAKDFMQKLQCLAQLGICIGAKAVGCSGHCIPPMIQCKLGAIGNWPAMFKCCADFIGCAAGGCLTDGAGGAGGGGLPEGGMGGGPPGGMMFALADDDYSPYQMAIATAFNDVSNMSYAMDLQHCMMNHGTCLDGAADLPAKVKCFIGFGMCIGLQAVGCTIPCTPNLAICTAMNIGNWPGTFICATKFVMCAKNHCLG